MGSEDRDTTPTPLCLVAPDPSPGSSNSGGGGGGDAAKAELRQLQASQAVGPSDGDGDIGGGMWGLKGEQPLPSLPPLGVRWGSLSLPTALTFWLRTRTKKEGKLMRPVGASPASDG